MDTLETLLERSSSHHDHLCPRQILGVRVGLAGMQALGFDGPPPKKRLLTILETDGCFADGVIEATACTVGHRTLRIEDYGKVAVTFVDTQTGKAVRVTPALDSREKASLFASDEPKHYTAQMKAYQTMRDEDLLHLQSVRLKVPIEQIVSRPGTRPNCEMCGEEIINEREVVQAGKTLCRSCAGFGYYTEISPAELNEPA
jgi:formylmethanofuran dehydrogenase subunit E